MHPDSIYGKRAIKAGLDPAKTSIHGLCCVENGLPYDSSVMALAARKAGRKEISARDAERLFGENVNSIYR